MRNVTIQVLNNLLNFTTSVATLLVTRWMMELSTPQEDLQATLVYIRPYYRNMVRMVRWYNGSELYHQLRAKRILMGLKNDK